MITFNPEFVATAYPGYFFNVKDEQLYSMKVDGILKPLKYKHPNHWNRIGTYPSRLDDGSKVYSKGGYHVSVQGRPRFYAIEQLKELKPEPHVIPVKEIVC